MITLGKYHSVIMKYSFTRFQFCLHLACYEADWTASEQQPETRSIYQCGERDGKKVTVGNLIHKWSCLTHPHSPYNSANACPCLCSVPETIFLQCIHMCISTSSVVSKLILGSNKTVAQTSSHETLFRTDLVVTMQRSATERLFKRSPQCTASREELSIHRKMYDR